MSSLYQTIEVYYYIHKFYTLILIIIFLVSKSICRGPCRCESYFQGHEHLLVNLNNRYLVHYGLLYEYSEMMRTGRNPLYAFVKYVNISM